VTRLLGAVLCVLLLPVSLGAQPPARSVDRRQAQLGLPTGPSADWREWDAFLTNASKTVGDQLGEARREQLRDLFLDSRYQLVQALSSGGSDPVPRLFLDSWGRLGPILRQALPELPADTATRYSGFISVMDGASSVGGFMQGLGLLRVTPDTLRSASALLGTSAADPLAYTLDVDGGLRALLGFAGMPGTPRLSPAVEQSHVRPSAAWRALLLTPAFATPAFAAEDEFDRLNEWVPAAPELSGYLTQVRRLLTQASTAALAKGKLAPQHHALYRQVVFTAGWQESCWRQFIRSGEKLTPLASATGDVGLMQVNRNTWPGLYDVKGLSGDIAYNANAGSEILLYCLSRYAVRKAEHRQPGGHLARATYSAYNGGPGQLGRYRNPKTPAVWKKVDEAFWTKFRTVSGGQELGVRACYAP
jgi:soluble lytic murein transglycosylase-like protein